MRDGFGRSIVVGDYLLGFNGIYRIESFNIFDPNQGISVFRLNDNVHTRIYVGACRRITPEQAMFELLKGLT